jgi:hypothetical protein
LVVLVFAASDDAEDEADDSAVAMKPATDRDSTRATGTFIFEQIPSGKIPPAAGGNLMRENRSCCDVADARGGTRSFQWPVEPAETPECSG